MNCIRCGENLALVGKSHRCLEEVDAPREAVRSLVQGRQFTMRRLHTATRPLQFPKHWSRSKRAGTALARAVGSGVANEINVPAVETL